MPRTLIALLIPCLATTLWAAQHQAAASGDWSAAQTWTNGIPADGDTIDIPDGITLTITDARTIGTSADNGTVAISLNKTGAIVLAKGAFLKVRGDVTYTAGQTNTAPAVTVQAAGHWQWDASKAPTPAQTHYRFRPSGDFGFRPFILDGSSDAPAVLDSDEAGGTGAFTRDGKNFAGPFRASFARISRIGDDKTSGWDIFWHAGGTRHEVTWDVQDCTFTDCGQIMIIGAMDTDGTFRHNRNVHDRSRGTSVIYGLPAQRPLGKGVRDINANIFDIAALQAEKAFADGYTITGNYFGGGCPVVWASDSWEKCERNLFRIFGQWTWVAGKRLADSFVLIDRDCDNPHVIFGPKYPVELDGLILSHAGTANMDSGEWIFCLPGCHHCIFLPNMYGYSSGEVTASGGGFTGGYIFEHNTWFGGYGKGRPAGKSPPGFSALQYSETGNNKPGDVKSFRSNIMWNPQLPGRESKFVKMCDIHSLYQDQKAGPPIQDVGDPKNIDNNTGWNYDQDDQIDFPNKAHYGNWGKGYIGNWSKAPGEHDVDVDPEFVDYQRDLPLYATKELIKTASRGNWQANPDKPYTLGDTVLNKTGIYWGQPILYRYIGTGAGDNPEPGAGTREKGDAGEWRKSWEWASLYYLREAIRTGQKFGDDDPVLHLVKWVRAGYAPTNLKLKGAAHDGTDIGAVPWQEKGK